MRNRFFFWIFSFYLSLILPGIFLEQASAEEHGGHKAHHGGVLNVIGKELGHVEVLVQGDTLEAWFVGGGEDTGRSVPVAAAKIPLKVTVSSTKQKKLTLKADPLKLAGEKMGHCSHFVAQADWLKDVKEFEARGEVKFKGSRQKIVVKYPEGYEPGHKKSQH
jgi:hypothetical protein